MTAAPAAEASSPAVARAGAWTGGVMLALAVATPLLAYLGNLGFAPAVSLAGLALAPTTPWRRAPWPLLALLAVAVAWAAVSLAWSPFHPPPWSLRNLQRLTIVKLACQLGFYGVVVTAAAAVPPRWAAHAAWIGGLGLTALSLLLVVEAVDGARLYQAIRAAAHAAAPRADWARRDMGRATFVLALLFWPAALGLSRRGARWAPVLILACALAAAVMLRIDSPVVALAVSTLVFALVRAGGRRAVSATGGAVLAYLLLAPLVVALAAPALDGQALSGGVGKASWGARLQIWGFVEGLIVRKPWVGWGLDASRAWPGVIPLHPHDGALQVWLELGLPGVLLAAAAWALVFRGVLRLERRDRSAAAAAAAAAVAYAVMGALSFGVWQEWWLALAALAAAWVSWLDRAEPPADGLPPLPPA